VRKLSILETVLKLAPLGATRGATTNEIAVAAGVLRQNASSDLNELCRDGLVRKNNGRPVLYWATDSATAATLTTTASAAARAHERVLNFVDVIGAQGSLRTAVEQAQAAMLYPPRGLPTLILGPTGAGKSHLAEMMHLYAIQAGRIKPDAPFNVLNCADYAANPQLLLAQLFGYVKGSFTGAEQTTPGMIEQTQNGVLFLDEMHRLPPEGQEMLFLLMDKGVYRMLGDGATQRKASVMLIGATSEDPHSSLLRTLLRRFPVVISIPDLNQRPLEERLALAELFLRVEAARVGIPVFVSPLVLVALLTFHTVGNVGELRTAILLACAKGFLSYIAAGSPSGPMALYLTHLSPTIQLDYLRNHRDTIKAEKLVGVEDRMYVPTENLDSNTGRADGPGIALNLYSELRTRMAGYLDSSLNEDEVQKLIQIDVDYYLRRLHGNYMALSSAVSARILGVVSNFLIEAGRELGHQFSSEVVTALALHLASAPRTDAGDSDRTFALVAHYPREYGVVKRLAKGLEEGLDLELTSSEMSFLALFLAAHVRSLQPPGIAVVVVCHGERTASSMADVANQLLGDTRVVAVDMPLHQSVDDTLQMVIQRIKETGRTDGALVLVDMGSLTGFGVTLERTMGLPVAVVPLVSTPAVIEAGRVANQGDLSLSAMVRAVKQIYNLDAESVLPELGKRVIITTCLTGQGTARKLAAFLREALPAELRDQIVVQPVDLESGSEIPELLMEGWRGTVVAVAGTVNPQLPNVPFVGMEQILFGEGIQSLVAFAERGQVRSEPIPEMTRDEAIALASRFAAESIDSVEGSRYAQDAVVVLHKVEELGNVLVTPSQAARWVIHFAFAVDRLRSDGLVAECNEMAYLREHHVSLLNGIERALQFLDAGYDMIFTEGEIGYLALIVLS